MSTITPQQKQAAIDAGKKEAINQASKTSTGQKVGDVAGYAVTGATLGSVVPVLGTVVGGAAGAVVGSVVAFWDDFNYQSPKARNANNKQQRGVLDKFNIPDDFDLNLYYSRNPDVVKWANEQGLNDAEYVKKQIAWHWFAYGINEGRTYPYKVGTQVSPELEAYFKYMAQQPVNKGTFDWVGGQFNQTKTGFHTNNDRPNLKAGDTVRVTLGDFTYTGKIVQMGGDTGMDIDSMFVLDIPRSQVPQTVNGSLGTWEKITPITTVVATTAAVGVGASIVALLIKKFI